MHHKAYALLGGGVVLSSLSGSLVHVVSGTDAVTTVCLLFFFGMFLASCTCVFGITAMGNAQKRSWGANKSSWVTIQSFCQRGHFANKVLLGLIGLSLVTLSVSFALVLGPSAEKALFALTLVSVFVASFGGLYTIEYDLEYRSSNKDELVSNMK